MTRAPTFCGKDCGGDACPLLAEVEGGRVVRMAHNPAAGPYLRACAKGFALPRAHYAPDRLRTPLVRTGPRGSGSFREAGWDEALGLVAERLGEIRARRGPRSTLCISSAGSLGALHDTKTLTKRFLNAVGGCTSLSSNWSNGAASFVLPYVLGPEWRESGFDASTMRHSRMIVLWGANILDTRLGSETPARLLEAKRRGAEIVVIDPRRTATAERAATKWLPILPGTDSALMLAVLHVLLAEGLVDRPYVEERAVGFGLLERHVLGLDDGLPKSPAWAGAACGLPASEISAFARSYAAAKPAMLLPGYSIQRVDGGEEPFRLAIALQLATGNFGVAGGSTGSLNNRLPKPRVGALGDLGRPGEAEPPVLRWPDLILEGRAGGYPADIAAAYSAGGNFMTQGGDLRKAVAAFERLEFAVCHDLFMTPTARHCDVVLPAASPLEKEDIGVPWHGGYLLHKRAAVAPEGLARNDYDIFAELAARMGREREFTLGRTAHEWVEAFIADSEIPDPDEFKRSGVYLAPDRERPGLAGFAADPRGRPLGTPSGRVELASEAYERDTGFPPIPTWRAPAVEPGRPLRLVTPKRADRVHSQGGGGCGSWDQELWINPRDARERSIAPGDAVWVENRFGRVRSKARVTDAVMPGVASLFEGRWFELDPDGSELAGSPNALTGTGGTPPSVANVMHGMAVEVARAE